MVHPPALGRAGLEGIDQGHPPWVPSCHVWAGGGKKPFLLLFFCPGTLLNPFLGTETARRGQPRPILLLTSLLSLADKLSAPSPSLGSSKHSCCAEQNLWLTWLCSMTKGAVCM